MPIAQVALLSFGVSNNGRDRTNAQPPIPNSQSTRIERAG
jgi:hypothetical protein